ncbi:hypothetical protein, partial [Burkholderia gladioli]|uniref:hypothetical protein n=1 Tax=Burkholderia gladioli TaxID=28095 RepID=UPI003F78D994
GRRALFGRLGRRGFRTFGRRIGILRFRRRATTRDQAARAATQAAARTVFAARVLAGLLGSVLGARSLGVRGFGRISVVGISQNNLEMSGLAPVAGAAISIWPQSSAALRGLVLVGRGIARAGVFR